MARDLLFVTGGSSGIGRAMIETRPDPEARVLNLSRRAGPESEHVEVDLSDASGWDRAARCFDDEIAAFDGERIVLVHSAGTLSPIGFAGEKDGARYRQNILLNSAAPQILGDAFLRALGDSPAQGVLLLIGSGAAHSAYAGWSGYCGGKAAADQWVRTVGLELEARGAKRRALCVAPGIVETAMQAEIRETPKEDFPEVEMFISLHEGGQLRTTREVAAQLWELLAKDAFENGAVLDLRELA